MNVRAHPENPSPLAGEVAARSAAGEGRGGAAGLGGVGSRGPSPGRLASLRPSSPARGEGKIEGAARSAAGEGRGGEVVSAASAPRALTWSAASRPTVLSRKGRGEDGHWDFVRFSDDAAARTGFAPSYDQCGAKAVVRVA